MKDISMVYGSVDNYQDTLESYDFLQKRRGRKLKATEKILISLVKAEYFAGKYVVSEVTHLFAKEDKYEVGDVIPLCLNSSSVDFYCIQQIEVISKDDGNEFYNKKLLFIEWLIKKPEKDRKIFLTFRYFDPEDCYYCEIVDWDSEKNISINDADLIELPSEYNGKSIKYLEINTPLSCKELVLPECLQVLNCDGFMLSKLERIIFPKCLEVVSDFCFYGSVRLRKIFINNKCNDFGDDCFDLFVSCYNEEIVKRYKKDPDAQIMVEFDGTLKEWRKKNFFSNHSNPKRIKQNTILICKDIK